MLTVAFDVNDATVRDHFFDAALMEAIEPLKPSDPPRWGNMSAQHMVEHLQWAFACSTGAFNAACTVPPHLLERGKRFLHDNRPTPREFRNPLLGELPPPYRFADLDAAKTALDLELKAFVRHFTQDPSALHIHPLFGPLGREEWRRSHFKHGFHHLLQFGLVAELTSTAPDPLAR